MSEPYEIIISPATLYLAPVGTAFPDVDTTPAAPWVTLGSHGTFDMDESGVTMTNGQTLNVKRTLGSTGGAKVSRTEESLTVSAVIVDFTAEQYAKVLNGVTVVDTAADVGTPGYRRITLHQGRAVTLYALIVRFASPYADAMASQYCIPVVYQSDSPAPVFNKTDMASLKCTWDALEDPNAATEVERFGYLDEQDADALP